MRRSGGVPERPKGTGCKPVGSAYGGSNPPAPTHSLTFSLTVSRTARSHGGFALAEKRVGFGQCGPVADRGE